MERVLEMVNINRSGGVYLKQLIYSIRVVFRCRVSPAGRPDRLTDNNLFNG